MSKASPKKRVTNEEFLATLPIEFLITQTSKGPTPTLCLENICRILRQRTNSVADIRYDKFTNIIEIKSLFTNASFDWRPLEDADVIHIQSLISIDFPYFQKVGKEMVYDAILKVSHEKAYDSAVDYVKGITWDQTPRLDSWLHHTLGVPNDVYHQAVASNWLKGLVKRICHPGCKFDYVLVLEGEQGVRKSTLLNILGGDWYVETTMSTDNKDFFMQFQGKAIIEFSEGETLSRTEVKRMKAIITTQVDKYRAPYERVSKDYPRRCVFAMTTNQEEYLKDETGNRRWLPVRVELPHANTEWLTANRDQLLAEAYHRVITLNEPVHIFPEEETMRAQRERRITDPNEDSICDWYDTLTPEQREHGITVEDAAKQALHKGFAQPVTRIEQMSISSVFREVLMLEKRQVRINGIRRYRYYPKDALEGMEVKVVESEDVKTF